MIPLWILFRFHFVCIYLLTVLFMFRAVQASNIHLNGICKYDDDDGRYNWSMVMSTEYQTKCMDRILAIVN